MATGITVNAEPYRWPIRGGLVPEQTAFLVIDMQRDFLEVGGYVDKLGYNIHNSRRAIEPIKKVLGTLRQIPGFTIIHIRQGHRSDLADCPDTKLMRSQRVNAAIGSQGPMGRILIHGEPGWDFIEELKPRDNEIIVDKPCRGSFYATNLDLILRNRGITTILICGVNTDVCVHSAMRDANDRGIDCLLLEDCCSSPDLGNHQAAVKMVKMQGGVFGAVANSADLLSALTPLLASKEAVKGGNHEKGSVRLAVNGTLMRGLELNKNLTDVGARFLFEAQTEPSYRLFSINDKHPAAIRTTSGGSAMAVEVWEVPALGLATILQKEPAGLSIGKVRLADASEVLGVLGEQALCEGMKEITQFGGWRNYIASIKA